MHYPSLVAQLQSSESLCELTAEAKLSLCNTFADHIMLEFKAYGAKLTTADAYITSLQMKLSSLQQEKNAYELAHGLFEAGNDFSDKWDQIDKLKESIATYRDDLQAYQRVQEPFGRIELTKLDSDLIVFVYFWHFESSLPNCLILEKRTVLENRVDYSSEWYLIDEVSIEMLKSRVVQIFNFFNRLKTFKVGLAISRHILTKWFLN